MKNQLRKLVSSLILIASASQATAFPVKTNELMISDIPTELAEMDYSKVSIEERSIVPVAANLVKLYCKSNGNSAMRLYSVAINPEIYKLFEKSQKAEVISMLSKNKDYVHGIKKIKNFEESGNIEAMKHWQQKIYPIDVDARAKASKNQTAILMHALISKNAITGTYYVALNKGASVYSSIEDVYKACIS